MTRPFRDISERDPGDTGIGFELEPEARAPSLPGQVVVRRDMEDLAGALLADLLVHAQNCVRSFGDFHMALSGGSTPMPVYMRLMTDPLYRSFPWKFTHLWVVDERRVPEEDERSNWRHLREIIADHADMPKGNVHPMRAEVDDADKRYEKELKQALAWREKGHDRLDFVLLGCGEDAHTASLFPKSRALGERSRLIAANDGPGVTPPPRLTMTYPLINAARLIAVLVSGERKRPVVEQLEARHASGADPSDMIHETPVLGVRPVGGVLKWFLDHPACPAG